MDLNIAYAAIGVVSAIGGAGGAWGAAHQRIKRATIDISKLDVELKDHVESDNVHHSATVQRLARIEALLEHIDRRIP